MELTARPRGFYYGWLIVVCTFLSNFMTATVGIFAFGVIFKPMSQELGWTRSMVTGAFTLRTFMGAFSAPVIGPLLDRLGPRPIMVVLGLVGGAGIMALRMVHEVWQFYLLYGVITALGVAGFGNIVTSTTIAKWFIRMRGRAMAITITGITTSGAIMAPVIQRLVAAVGWRDTWVILGLMVWLLVIVPAGLFMRRQPEDMGLLPDGDNPGTTVQREAVRSLTPGEQTTWTLRAALRTPTVWFIIAAFNLAGMGTSAIVIHEVAYLTDKGFSPTTASTTLGLHAFFAATGNLLFGFLAERVPVRFLIPAGFLGNATGVLILMNAPSFPFLVLFAMVYGTAVGGYLVLNPLIWANYFGRTFLGTIRGVLMPANLVASAGGPLLAAFVFDVTDSYHVAFTLYVATWLAAASVILLARPPRQR